MNEFGSSSFMYTEILRGSFSLKKKPIWVTIDDERSRAAASLGHDVASHTGVVGRVREPRLFDDQVVIDGDQKVGVLRWIDDVLVL